MTQPYSATPSHPIKDHGEKEHTYRTLGGEKDEGRAQRKKSLKGVVMSRIAQQGDRMGTHNRRRQAGMASDRSLIERWGMADTLAALLNFFCLIDTGLDSTLLTATNISRHVAMTHACIAPHFVDVRTLGEPPTPPHLSPCTFGVQLISPHHNTQCLSPCGGSVLADRMLQPRDTTSLKTVDLGSVRERARAHWSSLKHPNSATHCRFLKSRKCTKVPGPCFLKIKRMHENDSSVFFKTRLVRESILHRWEVGDGFLKIPFPSKSVISSLHKPLHRRAKRDPEAKILPLQSFLRKGVSLGHVGRN